MAYFVRATPAEVRQSLLDNVQEWRGALTEEAFFRREAHLGQQDLTRNGGLTGWILTPSADKASSTARPQWSACETIRKHALLATPAGVKEVLCDGVCSVFCPTQHRGNGYPTTMIAKLAEHLDREDIAFSVLYSDIGKKFYAKHGFEARDSRDIKLPPAAGTWPEDVQKITAEQVKVLCKRDAVLLRKKMERVAKEGRNAVVIIPDEPTFTWHHARESFVAKETRGKVPDIHGAITQTADGRSVWCLWSRFFYNTVPTERKGNTLYILRLVVEDEEYDDTASTEEGAEREKDSEVAKAIAKLFQAAQVEADLWTMEHVEIWNPSSATLAAARSIDPSTQVHSREIDSITALRWCDKSSQPEGEVEWMANEKYGWL